MNPGDVYRRKIERQQDPRGRVWEPIGTAVRIEECGLTQQGGTAPVQARVVFTDGPRMGEKAQWAESYIEDAFQLEAS